MKTFPAVLAVVLGATVSCSPFGNRVVFATDAGSPPLEFLDAAGGPVGFDVDLARELGRVGGFDVEIRTVPWDGLFPGLDRGDFDAVVSSVVLSPVLQASYDFSEPYLAAGPVLVVPVESRVAGTSDWKGGKVAVLTGTLGASVAGSALGPKTVVVGYGDLAAAFDALATGTVTGVVVDFASAARHVVEGGRHRGEFRMVEPPLSPEGFGIAVKKGNLTVLRRINEALAKSQEAGGPASLAKRWFQPAGNPAH